MTSFSLAGDHNIDFEGLAGCQFLDDIDLDDLFAGIHFDTEEVLLELEVGPEFQADLNAVSPENANQVRGYSINEDYLGKISGDDDGCSVSIIEADKKDEKERKNSNSPAKKKAKKNNSNNNNNRKTKVDWTPELHRRFVEAVEKLGLEKAVPSRILELMAIPCLTRHNIASHLQKYRSHRKHLVAWEAEARWSQKRQIYGGEEKSNSNCHKPTMGFPQPPHHHHGRRPFQPLHVWGHPTHLLQHQSMTMPQQLVHPYSPYQYRFASPLVQGIPPPQTTVYKPQHGVVASSTPQSGANHPPLESHPTEESIDKAIGEILTKPRLPLPIGLKPPSMESVMEDLHRHGIPNIPPSNSTTSHIC